VGGLMDVWGETWFKLLLSAVQKVGLLNREEKLFFFE
jgi:hypothetical protein